MKMSETALGNQKVNSERGASIYSQIAGLAFITIQACRLHIVLKGGYNMLTRCKSFADAFIIQTCGNNKQLDYATPRSTNCAYSAVFKQNRFNSA